MERCKFPATAPYRLKERDGAFDFPKDVVVCDLHREQLSNPTTEWVLLNDREGRRLLVGPMLAELDEYIQYILLEPFTKLTGHMASRDFSHPEHNGYHVPLKVRRDQEDRRSRATATTASTAHSASPRTLRKCKQERVEFQCHATELEQSVLRVFAATIY